ncbi:MAG: dihydrolipoamide acetyltransferase family protein [Candidatus Dormibacteraceae bacterium]
MSTTKVTMPQLGESVHEATISRWLVEPGGRVVEFEPMLEVETDKVSAEVPSPVTGVLKEVLVKDGDTVRAGADIALVELESDGAGPASEAGAALEAGAAPEDGQPPPPKSVAEQVGPAPNAEAREAQGTTQAALPGDAKHRFSPAVLMLSEEHQVDLNAVPGTGLGGRVTKKDVLAFIDRNRQPSVPQPTPQAPPPAHPHPHQEADEGDEVVPLTQVRRLIAENMTRSKATIPHAWQTQEVDMSGVVANRSANKAAFQQKEGFSLTFLPYVIAAATSALRTHPHVNATFNDSEILIHRDVNIGVSIGLEDTLLVPVIRRADGLSIAGIARAVADLAERARSRRIQADDLRGGTFTVNNSGTFGTLFSYSVINPGQAGILTMEAVVERPVAVQGMIGIRPLMYLCFSFDHRLLDGLQAARFLASCRKWLEEIAPQTPIY